MEIILKEKNKDTLYIIKDEVRQNGLVFWPYHNFMELELFIVSYSVRVATSSLHCKIMTL